MPADSSTVATTAEQLGDAPPCRSYKSLIVLADFSELANDIWKCETKEEFAGVATKWRPFKIALAELVSMSNAALEATPSKRVRQTQADPSRKQKLKQIRVPLLMIAIPETGILKAQPVQVMSTNDIVDAKKTSDLLSAT